MDLYPDSRAMIAALKPEEPVYCLHLAGLQQRVSAFLDGFPGEVLYAIKANPMPAVVDRLFEYGVRHFDTASIGEIEQVSRAYPGATSYFMHPVKPWSAIHGAYHDHGVRHFVIDSQDELDKIAQALGGLPEDLVLVVRMATSGCSATFNLSEKFGCDGDTAVALLRAVESAGPMAGLAFHVGSQCTAPAEYGEALAQAGQVLRESQVSIACLDVGGGFPATYLAAVPPLTAYLDAIRAGLAALELPADCRVLCEPGRVLVAEALSLVVQVQMRRGDVLYINDGIYGSLYGTTIGLNYPLRVWPDGRELGQETTDFTIYGPTCDSLDVLPRPLSLPTDIATGDWLEFGTFGAYTAALITGFNGFRPDRVVGVESGFAVGEKE